MFKNIFNTSKPIIGMIHLPPSPGYPGHPGMETVVKKALADMRTLEEAGFDAVLVENDNDQPHQIGVSSEVIEAFESVMEEVLNQAKIPVGLQILYDILKTVESAHKIGVSFVRLDVFVDNVETKWGKIDAQTEEINVLKRKLGAEDIVLLTDIQVKHAKMLERKSLVQSAEEAIENGSDGLIVTGTWTGKQPSIRDLKAAKEAASGKVSVLVGSGFSYENAQTLLKWADGAIVGTSIKTGDYIDFQKAKDLINVVQSKGR